MPSAQEASSFATETEATSFLSSVVSQTTPTLLPIVHPDDAQFPVLAQQELAEYRRSLAEANLSPERRQIIESRIVSIRRYELDRLAGRYPNEDDLPSDLQQELQEYRAALQRPSTTAEQRRGITEHLKFLEQQAREVRLSHAQATAQAAPNYVQPPAISVPSPTMLPTATPEWGITLYEGWGPGWFIKRNGWHGIVNGQEIAVTAGTDQRDYDQGWLVVTEYDRTKPEVEMGIYIPIKAPFRGGSLRIIRVEDELLILEASNGQQIGFDAVSRQFIGQPTAPAPTQVLSLLPDLYTHR